MRTRGVDGTVVSYPGADGGEVGGSSRRERYPVPGTAPRAGLLVDVFAGIRDSELGLDQFQLHLILL